MAFKIRKTDYEELSKLYSAVTEALIAYRNKLDEVYQGFNSDFDDKSEKWQESDKGEAVKSWIDEMSEQLDELENFKLDEIKQEPE